MAYYIARSSELGQPSAPFADSATTNTPATGLPAAEKRALVWCLPVRRWLRGAFPRTRQALGGLPPFERSHLEDGAEHDGSGSQSVGKVAESSLFPVPQSG